MDRLQKNDKFNWIKVCIKLFLSNTGIKWILSALVKVYVATGDIVNHLETKQCSNFTTSQ